MIDLIYWSFVVAFVPIALSMGSRLIAVVANPFGPPHARPFLSHGRDSHAPHFALGRVGRTGGFDHGR